MARLPAIDVTHAAGELARQALGMVAGEIDAQQTINDMLCLPGEIAALEANALETQAQADRMRRENLAEAKEALSLAEIAAQMEAPEEATNGKNAETRKRAMDAHLAQDPDIRVAKVKVLRVEEDISELEGSVESRRIQLREKVNLFSALRHAADLQTQLLRLFGQAGE